MNVSFRQTLQFFASALLLALSIPVGKAHPSKQLVVGNSSQDCLEAAYPSIQSALDAASSGDSIRICKGVYQEQLSITKSLDIDPDEGFVVPPNRQGIGSRVRIGTLFRNGFLSCFVLVLATLCNLAKSFVLSVQFVEKRLQNIRTDSLRVFVMSDDLAQSHPGLDCVFVPVPLGSGPKSLHASSLDNPAFFHGGTHQ